MTVIYDHHLAANALTIGQYSLIARIGKSGPIGVIPLAINMGMDRSTMSRALKPLISAGWVQTVDLPLAMLTDKRSFGVTLTPEGTSKWKESMQSWNKAQEEVTAILGDENHQTLLRLIDDANDKFQYS